MSFKSLSKKKFVVVGLGVSGISVSLKLIKSKISLFGWDDNYQIRHKAKSLGINVKKIEDIDFKQIDYLIMSPGISHLKPNKHISAKLAEESNCKIITDIELLNFLDEKKFTIGITGTNGKSTTTLYLQHILNKLNIKSQACGNIGTPITDINFSYNQKLIIEASSFQLERIDDFKFDIGILLNITNDHLDRHISIANYIKAKLKIFNKQTKNDYAIISVDDKNCLKISNRFKDNFKSKLVKISTKNFIKGGISLKVSEDFIYIMDDFNHCELKVSLHELSFFKSDHNYQNLLAVYAACKCLKINNKNIARGILGFKGLEHRIEKISEFKNISFYNDSKATNVSSAKIALSCLKNIYWIAGGRSKLGGLDGIGVKELKNVRKIFTYGESSSDFKEYLINMKDTKEFKSLDEALKSAFMNAKKEKININITLSPACSSFDQFNNFEDRGNYFKKIVKKIK